MGFAAGSCSFDKPIGLDSLPDLLEHHLQAQFQLNVSVLRNLASHFPPTLDWDPDFNDYLGSSMEIKWLPGVYKDSDGASANYTPPSMTGFRLLDLPAELRYHIYSFLIPHKMVITFERSDWLDGGEPDWTTYAYRKGVDVPLRIGGDSFYKNSKVRRHNHFTVETQLFRVSKFVSNEARCKLSL